MRHLICLAIALCALSVANPHLRAQEEAPDWVRRQRNDAYPEMAFFQGVGLAKAAGDEAKDWKTAENQARAEVARQIRTRVSGVVSSNQREEIFNNKNTVSQIVEEAITSSVDMSVSGLLVRDRFYDKRAKLYYVLVTLNRAQTAAFLKARLENADAAVRANLAYARAAIDKGDALTALRAGFDAVAQWSATADTRDVYTVVNPLPSMDALNELERKQQTVSWAEVNTPAEELVASLRLEIVSGDRQEMDDANAVEPLVIRLSFTRENTRVPAVNTPVRFAFSQQGGSIAEHAVTDASGVAKGIVYRMPDPSGDACLVEASLDLSTLEPFPDAPAVNAWQKRLAQTRVTFSLNRQAATLDGLIAALAKSLVTPLPRSCRVVFDSFTYQETRLTSQFGQYLKSGLQAAFVKSGSVAVLETKPFTIARSLPNPTAEQAVAVVSDADAVVVGQFWEQSDNIRVMARVRSTSGQVLATANQIIPRGLAFAELKPQNTTQALLAAQDLSAAAPGNPQSVSLRAWTDQGGRALYRNGASMTVFVRSDRDRYIRLVYHDVEGNTIQLYPNEFSDQGFIRAGETKTIPGPNDAFKFVTSAPFGAEVLKVYASAAPFPVISGRAAGPYTVYEAAPRDVSRGMGVVGEEVTIMVTTMP